MAKRTDNLEPSSAPVHRRKSMDPVSEYIRVEELPDPLERFVLQERLRTGSSYKLYCGIDKQKGKKVAVKVIGNVAENILEIEAEYKVLSTLGGQSLVPEFYGAFLARAKESEQELWFVMELHEGILVSDLRKWLKKERKSFTEEEISILLKSMLLGLETLHSKDIIHRDIRASNFSLSYTGEIKLLDFGFCMFLKDSKPETHSAVGSPSWMAPEVISCDKISSYSKNCDIWSIGITAIELAEGWPPLGCTDAMQAILQTVRYPPPTLKKLENWTDLFKDFVNDCLGKCPDSRPCSAELLFHPFIAEANGEKTLQSIEEYLKQEIERKIGTKGNEILKRLGRAASEMAEFHTTDTEEIVPIMKNLYLKKGPDFGYERMIPDDVTFLDNISEECLAEVLCQRYSRKDVYTHLADILVAINPQRDLSLFKPEKHMDYCEKSRNWDKPHIFAVADKAYRQMLHHKSDQAIIFIGEAGSGKTTAVKHLINHLMFLATTESRNDIGGRNKHIVPILDTFGNVYQNSYWNDSSRYIKMISITFGQTGKTSGALLSAMLLDDWRFPCKVMTENNYHVFYYIYEGLKSENRLKDFNLDKLTKFRYLPEKEKRKKENLLNGYKSLISAFDSFSFEDDELRAILRVISALLLFGDIDFEERDHKIQISNPKMLEAACEHSQMNFESLETIFTETRNINESMARRDAVALCLYRCLFDWIVESLNQKMAFSRLVFGHDYSIHVLDTPGYHSSKEPDIHQLSANMLSDLLQKILRKLIFSMELEQYKEEGVDIPFVYERTVIQDWDVINDNLDILKIINNLRSTEEADVHNILKSSSTAHYVETKGENIVVRHIFGETVYNNQRIRGNWTTVENSDMISALKTITDSSIAYIFEQISAGNFPSTDLKFPLITLNNMFAKEFPHVVMCFNPDESPAENKTKQDYVTRQMRAFNLSEVALIRQQGYARRISFSDFLNRYKYLAFDFNEEVELTEDNCKLLLLRLRMDGWRIGKTKVFLKYYAADYLTRLYEEHVKKIVKIQATARRFIVRIRQKGEVGA